MERALWVKIAAISALAVVLLVPLKLIESKIVERQATREAVVAELANTSAGEQTLTGPLLVLPCTEYDLKEAGDAKVKQEDHARDCTRTYVADQLNVAGTLKTETRYRGIYSARFYVSAFRFEGRFEIPAEATPANVRRVWKLPFVAFAVRDVRGIRSAASLSWDGMAHAFSAGLGPNRAGSGVHAVIGNTPGPLAGAHAFSFQVEIMGLQNLSFAPSARRQEVTLAADWPHPSFVGRHLPVAREVRKDGFQATWRTSDLSSEAPHTLVSCADAGCKAMEPYVFGVTLIDPVDVYVQANRAVKYALLFVLLTFSVFFVFETVRDCRIHPVQYALVGFALAVFFLLLIALSEHIRFTYAYLLSAGACVTLIALYVHAMLGSMLRAAGLASMLTALYTMLYALLRSEDYSLLLGALLVFGVLAAVMLLTRRIDWYAVVRTAPTR